MNLTLGDAQTIIAECKKQNLLRNQAAYVLGTAYWETAKTLKPVKEAYWLSETWRKNNLRYYPYYGRGYVQLTWDYNYEKYGIKDEPDKALEPELAAYILVDGMKNGIFTGKKLSDYITLQKSDFVGARPIVNGTDKAREIADLAKQYDADLKAIGYGEEKPETSAGVSSATALLELIFDLIKKFLGK
ncbi:carboxypeptidase [Phyllobacterium sp. SB3]|uniref:carboxypeptidase n=1 Tax=Phyllobacterium sp. SB3 TaxID=3156073 RepID=UPI0032AEABD7